MPAGGGDRETRGGGGRATPCHHGRPQRRGGGTAPPPLGDPDGGTGVGEGRGRGRGDGGIRREGGRAVLRGPEAGQQSPPATHRPQATRKTIQAKKGRAGAGQPGRKPGGEPRGGSREGVCPQRRRARVWAAKVPHPPPPPPPPSWRPALRQHPRFSAPPPWQETDHTRPIILATCC